MSDAGGQMTIDNNGDISFYEDTGTTAKFFWDASAESLGIGTSSPSAPLHVFKSGGSTTSINVALTLDYESPTASLAGSGTAILFKGKSGGGNLAQYDQAMISTNNIGSNNSHGLSFFYKPNAATALTEGLTLDEEGNVGIGVTPLTKLHVLSGTDNNIAAGVSEVRFIGADKAITGEQANLVIQTNDDMAVNKGGSIGLGGRHTTSSTNGVNFAQISGRKENATSANFAGYLAFGTSDSASDIHERMRIDSSGNVGIGLSGAIPSARLQVRTGTNLNLAVQTGTTDTSGMKINAFNDAANTNIPLEINGSVLLLKTGETERARIDSSGNVGIGTSSPSLKGHINGASSGLPATSGTTQTNGVLRLSSSATSGIIDFGMNGASPWIQATDYTGLNNNYNLLLNPNGGNVGIGTDSPSDKLTIKAASAHLRLQGTSNTNKNVSINYNESGDYGQINCDESGVNQKDLWMTGLNLKFGRSTGSESMRIDDLGNLGLGVVPSAWSAPAFQISRGSHFADTGSVGMQHNAYFNSGWKYIASSQGALQFQAIPGTGFLWNTAPSGTAGNAISFSEAMRIDSSGNLLVGRSSAGAAATDNGHVFYGSGQHYIFSNATECVRFYETSGSGQQVGSISITSSATAFNTSSDERLKENITDAPAGNIDDIKVRSFDWKADGSHQDYGMVAQELEAVAPYAVTKGQTEDDMWSVDYSKLVPMLIKEIQDLKAEVAALKGAN
jgi:hypothetical protein